jgi:hypothetical protein
MRVSYKRAYGKQQLKVLAKTGNMSDINSIHGSHIGLKDKIILKNSDIRIGMNGVLQIGVQNGMLITNH